MNASNKATNDNRLTLAEQADIHELYETSVQSVETEVEFLRNTFRQIRGREAFTYREDFCGTASASCEWVRQGPEFVSYSVDFDGDVLAWGREHRVSRLDEEAQSRTHLIEGNVLSTNTPPVDIIGAFNFSYYTFKTRDELRRYFSCVREALKDDGVFFLDMFGGPEAYEETKETTKHDGFTYVWHQAVYHPVTGFMRCHIHFTFPDGSRIKKAFTYEWRLWSIPEIREVLLEAGFTRVSVYWEGTDEDGEGNGEFTPDEKGEADLAWIAYVVAEK